jgi:hypothetical protein
VNQIFYIEKIEKEVDTSVFCLDEIAPGAEFIFVLGQRMYICGRRKKNSDE